MLLCGSGKPNPLKGHLVLKEAEILKSKDPDEFKKTLSRWAFESKTATRFAAGLQLHLVASQEGPQNLGLEEHLKAIKIIKSYEGLLGFIKALR